MHMFVYKSVYSSFIHNWQKQNSAFQWIDGQTNNGMYSYNGIYYSSVKEMNYQATIKHGITLNPCCEVKETIPRDHILNDFRYVIF